MKNTVSAKLKVSSSLGKMYHLLFLQLEQIKVYLKYISAPKTAQIHMEQIIHSYTVQ